MSDKTKFMEKLEEAHRNPIGDELKSQLMQSYRKTIREKFEDAFPSNRKRTLGAGALDHAGRGQA